MALRARFDKVFPVLALGFFAAFLSWFAYAYLRTRANDISTLRAVSAADFRSVRLFLWSGAPEDPVDLAPAAWSELASRLRRLPPTEDVGRREHWSILRAIEIKRRDGTTLRLLLSTRSSLQGGVRLSVGASLHYFVGDGLWQWLSERPEVKAQEALRAGVSGPR